MASAAGGGTGEVGQAVTPTWQQRPQRLVRLLDDAGARAGKYTADVRGAQGVQIGDHNRRTMCSTPRRAVRSSEYDR